MNKIGEKFIEGKLVNLDKEPIESLEKMTKVVTEKEETLKYDLDGIMNHLISE